MLFQVFLVFDFKPGLFAPKTRALSSLPSCLGRYDWFSGIMEGVNARREEVKKVHAQENGGIQPVVPEKGRLGGLGWADASDKCPVPSASGSSVIN